MNNNNQPKLQQTARNGHQTKHPDKAAIKRLIITKWYYFRGTSEDSFRSILMKRSLMLVLYIPYLISPIDVIPDFIPVMGFVDDLTLGFIVLITMFMPPARNNTPTNPNNGNEHEKYFN